LRETLLAAEQAPFYRERFAQAGVNPSRFESLGQLADYPLLTKQDLLTQREALVNPQLPSRERLYITTGGSSGTPVGFYLQKGVSRPKEQAYLEAQWGRRGWRAGERTAVIRGGVTSSRAKGSISYYDATRNWLILSSYHLTAERMPDYITALNGFAPRHLHMYPSAALMLARGLEERGMKLDFRLTSILCGSEKLTAEAQAFVERVFEAPVLHWYGHSERVVLAAQGRKSNALYFWPAYGFVEFGEPTEEGHCEIIGTSFHNHAMPLVRYRTGDYVRASAVEKSASGEFAWPSVDEVIGREYEFLVSGTGRSISLTAINMHDRVFDDLMGVQFYQEAPGLVELRLLPGTRWNSTRQDGIRAGVLKKLGDDFKLELRVVNELEKTSAGKHRWLVTKL
jgi:phenylacetate-CoA ligase